MGELWTTVSILPTSPHSCPPHDPNTLNDLNIIGIRVCTRRYFVGFRVKSALISHAGATHGSAIFKHSTTTLPAPPLCVFVRE